MISAPMKLAPLRPSTRAQLLFRRAVVCMGLLAVAMVSALITMRLAIHGAEVQVPDLRGMTAADAIKRASDMGLSATIADRFYSADIPLGDVLTQFPAPGATVRGDWIVRLVESLGPQSISVPQVSGMSQRDAVLAIRKAHLDLGSVAVVPYSGAPAGTVIAQDPPAGAHQVDRPRVALLIASEGNALSAPTASPAPPPVAEVVVPQIVGQPFHDAAQSVLAAGLKLAPMKEATAAAPSAKSGTVLATSPHAGAKVPKGAAVQITLAP